MPIYNFDSRPEVFKELDLINHPPVNILDVGCGEGDFIMHFHEYNSNIWAIEPVEKFAKIASSKVNKLICQPVEEAIKELPDGYFDYIFFNDVLEHLYDPEEILLQIKSKLKPDGFIVTSIPNVRFFQNLKEVLVKQDWEYKDQGILDDTHIRFFTQKSILRMWDKLNFKIIKFKGINRMNFSPFNKFYMLLKILSKGKSNEDTRYLNFVTIMQVK